MWFIVNGIFFAIGKPRNYSWKMDSCSCKWMWSENNWLYSKVCYFIFLLLWSSKYFDWSHLVFMFVSWDISSFGCYHHEVISLSVFVVVSNFSLILPQAHVNLIFTGSGLGHEVHWFPSVCRPVGTSNRKRTKALAVIIFYPSERCVWMVTYVLELNDVVD